MFLQFLSTAQIYLGLPVITSVQSFFKSHLESREFHYRFYRRAILFHFGDYTNASVEGENSAMKSKSTVTAVNLETETFSTITIFTLNGI